MWMCVDTAETYVSERSAAQIHKNHQLFGTRHALKDRMKSKDRYRLPFCFRLLQLFLYEIFPTFQSDETQSRSFGNNILKMKRCGTKQMVSIQVNPHFQP
jgi:hypothetical protein